MRFTLTSEDLGRMQRLAMERILSSMPSKRLLFFLRGASWFAIALAFFRLLRAHECCQATQPFLQQAAYAALAAVVLFAISNYVVRSAFAKGSVAAGGWFTSEQSVVVKEEHLLHGTRLGEVAYPWSAFLWRTEDERNFYLFIDQGIGFVFPKAAVPIPAEQDLIRAKVAE